MSIGQSQPRLVLARLSLHQAYRQKLCHKIPAAQDSWEPLLRARVRQSRKMYHGDRQESFRVPTFLKVRCTDLCVGSVDPILGPTSNPAGLVPARENVPPNFSTNLFTDKSLASSRTSQATSNSGVAAAGDVGPTTPQKTGFESEPGYSPEPFYGNFSRPLSARHSTQPSYARSSAPSGTPTISSNAMPTSPTETQATSFLTEGSDVGQGPPEMLDLERPSSGYSSGLGTSTVGSSGHSPMDREKSSTSIPRSSGAEAALNGHVEPDRVVRKKNSRFRLKKFWKRPGEATP
jgi:hypothetical protein